MNKYYTLSKSDRPVTSWATDLDACDYDVKNNNTLWDSRLGAIGSRNLCKTCDNLIDQCIGHMGHITLATAIPHPFMRRRIAASASLICHECKQFVASPFSWIPLQVWENPAFVEETRNIDGFQAAVPAMSMILALMTKYFKNKKSPIESATNSDAKKRGRVDSGSQESNQAVPQHAAFVDLCAAHGIILPEQVDDAKNVDSAEADMIRRLWVSVCFILRWSRMRESERLSLLKNVAKISYNVQTNRPEELYLAPQLPGAKTSCPHAFCLHHPVLVKWIHKKRSAVGIFNTMRYQVDNVDSKAPHLSVPQPLDIRTLFDIFENLPSYVASVLTVRGHDTPQDMFFTVIPVMATTMRIPTLMYNGSLIKDEFTTLYVGILDANSVILKKYGQINSLSDMDKHALVKNDAFQTAQVILQIAVYSLLGICVASTKKRQQRWTPGFDSNRNKNGAAAVGIAGAVNGKEGKFRLDMNTKRIRGGSARGVISPAPIETPVGSVIVPESFAVGLATQHKITNVNMASMQKLLDETIATAAGRARRSVSARYMSDPVNTGVVLFDRVCLSRLEGVLHTYGAKDVGDFVDSVVRPPPYKPFITSISRWNAMSNKYDVRFVSHDTPAHTKLQVGMRVTVTLATGDEVLFNRAPTLKRTNMQANKAIVGKNKSIQMVGPQTGTYKADFDGDTMTVSLRESETAKAEMQELSCAAEQIREDSVGVLALALVAEPSYGLFVLTDDQTGLLFCDAMQLLYKCCCSHFGEHSRTTSDVLKWLMNRYGATPTQRVNPRTLVSGKDVLSAILAQTSLCYIDKLIDVRNGVIQSGRVYNQHVGRSGGLLRKIVDSTNDNIRSMQLVGALSYLGDAFATLAGWSLSREEVLLTKHDLNTLKAVQAVIKDESRSMQERADAITNHNQNGIKTLDLWKSNGLFRSSSECDNGSMSLITDVCGFVGIITVGSQSTPSAAVMYACLADYPCAAFNQVADANPLKRVFITSNLLLGMRHRDSVYPAEATQRGLMQKALGTEKAGELERHVVRSVQGLYTNLGMTLNSTEPHPSVVSMTSSLLSSRITQVTTRGPTESLFIKHLNSWQNNELLMKFCDFITNDAEFEDILVKLWSFRKIDSLVTSDYGIRDFDSFSYVENITERVILACQQVSWFFHDPFFILILLINDFIQNQDPVLSVADKRRLYLLPLYGSIDQQNAKQYVAFDPKHVMLVVHLLRATAQPSSTDSKESADLRLFQGMTEFVHAAVHMTCERMCTWAMQGVESTTDAGEIVRTPLIIKYEEDFLLKFKLQPWLAALLFAHENALPCLTSCELALTHINSRTSADHAVSCADQVRVLQSRLLELLKHCLVESCYPIGLASGTCLTERFLQLSMEVFKKAASEGAHNEGPLRIVAANINMTTAKSVTVTCPLHPDLGITFSSSPSELSDDKKAVVVEVAQQLCSVLNFKNLCVGSPRIAWIPTDVARWFDASVSVDAESRKTLNVNELCFTATNITLLQRKLAMLQVALDLRGRIGSVVHDELVSALGIDVLNDVLVGCMPFTEAVSVTMMDDLRLCPIMILDVRMSLWTRTVHDDFIAFLKVVDKESRIQVLFDPDTSAVVLMWLDDTRDSVNISAELAESTWQRRLAYMWSFVHNPMFPLVNCELVRVACANDPSLMTLAFQATGPHMSKLPNVLYTLFPHSDVLDIAHARSSYPLDMIQVFGVEAARGSIIFNIERALDIAGQKVDRIHLELLADLLTQRGILQHSTVDGFFSNMPPLTGIIDKVLTSVWNACVEGIDDNLTSVQSAICVGTVPKGRFEVRRDRTFSKTPARHVEPLLLALDSASPNPARLKRTGPELAVYIPRPPPRVPKRKMYDPEQIFDKVPNGHYSPIHTNGTSTQREYDPFNALVNNSPQEYDPLSPALFNKALPKFGAFYQQSALVRSPFTPEELNMRRYVPDQSPVVAPGASIHTAARRYVDYQATFDLKVSD